MQEAVTDVNQAAEQVNELKQVAATLATPAAAPVQVRLGAHAVERRWVRMLSRAAGARQGTRRRTRTGAHVGLGICVWCVCARAF